MSEVLSARHDVEEKLDVQDDVKEGPAVFHVIRTYTTCSASLLNAAAVLVLSCVKSCNIVRFYHSLHKNMHKHI